MLGEEGRPLRELGSSLAGLGTESDPERVRRRSFGRLCQTSGSSTPRANSSETRTLGKKGTEKEKETTSSKKHDERSLAAVWLEGE